MIESSGIAFMSAMNDCPSSVLCHNSSPGSQPPAHSPPVDPDDPSPVDSDPPVDPVAVVVVVVEVGLEVEVVVDVVPEFEELLPIVSDSVTSVPDSRDTALEHAPSATTAENATAAFTCATLPRRPAGRAASPRSANEPEDADAPLHRGRLPGAPQPW
jgi:hypothetical protein